MFDHHVLPDYLRDFTNPVEPLIEMLKIMENELEPTTYLIVTVRCDTDCALELLEHKEEIRTFGDGILIAAGPMVPIPQPAVFCHLNRMDIFIDVVHLNAPDKLDEARDDLETYVGEQKVLHDKLHDDKWLAAVDADVLTETQNTFLRLSTEMETCKRRITKLERYREYCDPKSTKSAELIG